MPLGCDLGVLFKAIRVKLAGISDIDKVTPSIIRFTSNLQWRYPVFLKAEIECRETSEFT